MVEEYYCKICDLSYSSEFQQCVSCTERSLDRAKLKAMREEMNKIREKWNFDGYLDEDTTEYKEHIQTFKKYTELIVAADGCGSANLMVIFSHYPDEGYRYHWVRGFDDEWEAHQIAKVVVDQVPEDEDPIPFLEALFPECKRY